MVMTNISNFHLILPNRWRYKSNFVDFYCTEIPIYLLNFVPSAGNKVVIYFITGQSGQRF